MLFRSEDEESYKEIYKSKSILESIINREVKLLSFPHGEYNQSHIFAAKNAGYSRVFSISPTRALLDQDEFSTGRILVDPDDWRVEFILKITGAYRWLPFVYRVKKTIINLFRK